MINHFPVTFYNKSYHTKPDVREMGSIQNQLKKKHDAELLSLEDILEKATQGQSWYAGKYKIELTQQELREVHELAKIDYSEAESKKAQLLRSKKLEFEGGQLLVIDIDDDFGEYEPKEVYDFIQAQALYFTFSNGVYIPELGTRQNAYRLILVLDKEVDNFSLVNYIGRHYKEVLEERFPMLQTKIVDGTNRSEVKPVHHLILGTNNRTYYLNKERPAINTEAHEYKFKIEDAVQKYSGNIKGKIEKNYYRPETPSDKELLEVAKRLGDTSHLLSREEWANMAIGIFYNAQMGDYSEETALEVIKITDSNNLPESAYRAFKRPVNFAGVPRTIATFIQLAESQGHKFSKTSAYANHTKTEQVSIPTETIKFSQYIETQDMLNIIQDETRKTLLVAPTNSGKTFSAVNAAKEFVKQNKNQFVYIATPTKLLGGQVASTYGLGKPLQGDTIKRNMIQDGMREGLLVRAGTYNQIEYVLSELPPDYDLTILVDEAHQEITAYSYRYESIRNLFELSNHERVRKFIGMTATPEPINLERYNKLVRAESIEPRAVAENLQILSYESAKLDVLDDVLTRTIAHEFKTNGNKVLAFINNIDLGEKIQRVLKKQGIRTSIINSEEADSGTYKKIVNDEVFPEDIDVIIATIALSDGVNIKNETDNFTTVIATHYIQSQLFDLSTIKQMANRFRNKYKKIIVPVFFKEELEEDRFTTKPFNLDAEHNMLMNHSQMQAQATKEVFEDDISLYRPSFVENMSGLYSSPNVIDTALYQAGYNAHTRQLQGIRLTDEEQLLVARMFDTQKELFTVDERYIRSVAVKNQAKYYSYFPYAFSEQLKKVLEVKNVKEIQTIDDFLDDEDDSDSQNIQEELKRLTQMAFLENERKVENVSNIVTQITFDKIQQHYFMHNKVDQSTETWKALKATMHPAQYASLKNLIKFLDLEQTLQELERVGAQSKKANELYNSLKSLDALVNLEKAGEAGKLHSTYLTFFDLLVELPEKELSAKEREAYLKKVVKKRKGRRLKETKATFDNFFVVNDAGRKNINGKRTRVSAIVPLNLAHIKEKHDLTDEEIKEISYRLKLIFE